MIGTRKVAGFEDRTQGSAMLLQGYVFTDVDLKEMARALKLQGGTPVADRFVSLSEFLGHEPYAGDIEAMLVAGLSHTMRWEFAPSVSSTVETEMTERLLAERFGRDAFIFGSSGRRYAPIAQKQREVRA